MTSKISLLVPLVFPMCCQVAYSQVTLTGAAWFSSTPTGATSVSMGYADGFLNTLGGDGWWDLWLALNPDGTSPVNGPSDAQASISIPLLAGQSYAYYIFGQGPCCSLGVSGLALFFNGNNATPGISVFGPLKSTSFQPDASSILSLAGNPVAGSGTSFYNSAGSVVVLTGYSWDGSGTPPGDVCQAFAFTPASGDILSARGLFTLRVFLAASLSLTQGSGAPGSKLTLTGSGFYPDETVIIYGGRIGTARVLATASTDSSGGFTTAASVPQHPLGPMDVYALGTSSQALGAATFSITPALAMNPRSVAPGGSTTASVAGFGAGETVNIYWNEPRQLLGTATVNGEGSGAAAITIPADAGPGIDAVIGVGQTTNAIGLGKVQVD